MQFETLEGTDKSNFVGNTIYGLIQSQFGEQFAPRITGMLLDEKVIDFKQLLTDEQYFRSKVNEANQLLVQSQGTAQQQWTVSSIGKSMALQDAAFEQRWKQISTYRHILSWIENTDVKIQLNNLV